MWIFTTKGFLSIVRHMDKSNILIVRSRFRGHIEKIFPKAKVIEDGSRDYRFRVELDIKEVARVIAGMVLVINYDNFKGSLDADDQGYYESCIDTYYVLGKNSGDWGLENFVYGGRRTDESKQVEG